MPTTLSDVYALLVLSFGVLSVLLLVVLVILLNISYRLKRLELKQAPSTEDVGAEVATVATVAKAKSKAEASEFEKFLEEDGKRRLLTKREQAAAFRDWRKQRGVTWGKDTP